MLIVVENRNAHAGFRLLLDLETFGPLDVLEVDAAEGRLQRDDDVDEPVDVRLSDLDVEHVDAGEFLEQDRLALHHRLAGERTDRAEAEHGGAVGQHRDQILAHGQRRGLFRIGRDRLAGESDARRIGERQVALVGERLGGDDLELSRAGLAMKMQGVRLEVGLALDRHCRLPSLWESDYWGIRGLENSSSTALAKSRVSYELFAQCRPWYRVDKIAESAVVGNAKVSPRAIPKQSIRQPRGFCEGAN